MGNFLLVIAVVFGCSFPAAAQIIRQPEAAPDRPIVSVAGQAEVMVAPDQVLFRLKAENINLDLNKAKAATDEEVKRAIRLARNYGVEPQNTQTSYIRISKHYTTATQNRPSIFDGYSVEQSTTILLTDISKFESLITDLVNAGVDDVSDLTFRLSQMRTHMDRARAMAITAAREKAVALARELRQEVGKAISIIEAGLSVTTAYEDEDSSSNNVSAADFDPATTSDNQSSIAPGMISIVARVKVVFELK